MPVRLAEASREWILDFGFWILEDVISSKIYNLQSSFYLCSSL